MIPRRIMLIAGEASGDTLAAELVHALIAKMPAKPEMFGAGGPMMTQAGVEVVVDMTAHSVIGLIEVVKKYSWYKKVFEQLKRLAIERKPDLIVCVDFSGFNRRFAHAIREFTRSPDNSSQWNPKIVQFVSPQVWASRPGRADKMAPDIDLLLCLFPFEKEWYANRTPKLRVEFVGHPMFDRHASSPSAEGTATNLNVDSDKKVTDAAERVPTVLLLPGSRVGELKRHLPVMIDAAKRIGNAEKGVRFEMVLPNQSLANFSEQLGASQIPNLHTRLGDLATALRSATIAIASTGTVTLECAYFGVPTIAMYKTSWSTYQIGKRIIQVKFLAMPNLLADEAIFPELIQNDATGKRIAKEALDLLKNPDHRKNITAKLTKVVASLGGPGATARAAQAILQL